MKGFRIIIVSLFLITALSSSAQKVNIERIDPPFWWSGMNSSKLQLMVYGENISLSRPVIDYPGVKIERTILVESPNYIFLDLLIDKDAKAGKFNIDFRKGKKTRASYTYELKQRTKDANSYTGFDNSDNIYLLMPDRFANGNPENDDMPGMLEKADRSNPNGRHGGDIQGIQNNLDYLKDMGVTAIWINPLLENNMPTYSYHGYAMTDLYKVDPRFGTNEDYKNLVTTAHEKGIKIIQDMVFNHLGTNYFWKDDLPSQDWYNEWPEFTRSNYRGGTVNDPNASEYDYNKMVKGWFDKTMADLNQNNPLMANYLIQNSIWWIEYLDLDGIRQDTYPYPFKDFMATWMETLLIEYPNYNVVGEVWLSYPQAVAYWLENDNNQDGYHSHLTNVFDFPLMYAITNSLNEEEGWSTGITKMYEILSQDYVYSDPNKLVLFADNHDGDRLYTKLGEDMNKFKMAMSMLFTMRGIPQLYYGTEILMTGYEHQGHGFIREDFPGGWEGDSINAFSSQGRTKEQNEAFNFIKKLMNWRKSNKTVQNGLTTHFIPEDGVYVYFRELNDECVMVIINNSKEDQFVDFGRFEEITSKYKSAKSVLDRSYLDKLEGFKVEAKSPAIFELHK
ncbi:MAG: alpha-amlyase [Marinilabiliales bacterium]|nr:MAG: alpha-amlyase [Marinilabiliales bacterium]